MFLVRSALVPESRLVYGQTVEDHVLPGNARLQGQLHDEQPGDATQVGANEARSGESYTFQIRTQQNCLSKIDLAQVRSAQVRLAQVRSVQMSLAQLGRAQDGLAQISLAQVRLAETGLAIRLKPAIVFREPCYGANA